MESVPQISRLEMRHGAVTGGSAREACSHQTLASNVIFGLRTSKPDLDTCMDKVDTQCDPAEAIVISH